ncbi:MAG: MarR family winged helix-turn-helix transcriptional regulator [Bdellovibrio sp.]|jgi:DNA-binding MarR family transcriptional regulator
MKRSIQRIKKLKVHPSEIDNHQPLARFMITLFNLFEDEIISDLCESSYSDITRTDLNTLRYIDQAGVTVGQLARLSGVSKQATSKQIEDLVERGYVQKTADKNDGRIVRVKFSNKGLGLLSTLIKIISGIEARYLKKIGKLEYGKLKKNLGALIDLYVQS